MQKALTELYLYSLKIIAVHCCFSLFFCIIPLVFFTDFAPFLLLYIRPYFLSIILPFFLLSFSFVVLFRYSLLKLLFVPFSCGLSFLFLCFFFFFLSFFLSFSFFLLFFILSFFSFPFLPVFRSFFLPSFLPSFLSFLPSFLPSFLLPSSFQRDRIDIFMAVWHFSRSVTTPGRPRYSSLS